MANHRKKKIVPYKKLGHLLVYKIFGDRVFVADNTNNKGYLLPEEVRFDAKLGRDDLASFLSSQATEDVCVGNYQAYLAEHGRKLEAPIPLFWLVLMLGVTYLVSQIDRVKESPFAGLAYIFQYLAALIFPAGPPELFMKLGHGLWPATGPHGPIGTTTRSRQCLPEIEIGLIISLTGKIIALTGLNDMTQNSIEGMSPLQLFWAKVFQYSCGIGPCWLVLDEPGKLKFKVAPLRECYGRDAGDS